MNKGKTKITILGSGTSTGIPMVGCSCPVCSSTDPRDKRLRTSALIQKESTTHNLLIDCGPDLRAQLLNQKIKKLSAVLLTHEHADHLHGVDDLRPLTFAPTQSPMPFWCSSKVKKTLQGRFPYIFNVDDHFKGRKIIGGGIPLLEVHEIPLEEEFEIIPGLSITCFPMPHGHGETLGVLGPDFAYIVDCHEIPRAFLKAMQERPLKLLIIDCLQRHPHQTHLSTEKAFAYAKESQAENIGLIHMNHDLSHTLLSELAQEAFKSGQQKAFPVYDGQQLNF